MPLVELHCHTIASKDSLTTPEQLLEAARRKGLDLVAVTDHNTIGGALKAKALDPQRIIIGEEILTQAGELLAFFVREEIPAGLNPMEAINRLRSQGAFISVSHPFDRIRNGHWHPQDLLRILPHVDAIETFNARAMWPGSNRRAAAFAALHGIPSTVGSDAHAAFELGRARLSLPPFKDTPSLRQALEQARPITQRSPLWVHLISRYAVWRKAQSGRGDASR